MVAIIPYNKDKYKFNLCNIIVMEFLTHGEDIFESSQEYITSCFFFFTK